MASLTQFTVNLVHGKLFFQQIGQEGRNAFFLVE
jgi:hypothetical protein